MTSGTVDRAEARIATWAPFSVLRRPRYSAWDRLCRVKLAGAATGLGMTSSSVAVPAIQLVLKTDAMNSEGQMSRLGNVLPARTRVRIASADARALHVSDPCR